MNGVGVTGETELEVECPRCQTSLDLEITEDSGEAEVECHNCDATLSVSWSGWGREVEVKISSVPAVDDDCPYCSNSLDLKITEESGEDDVECYDCGSTLSVSWSNWGENVKVELLEEGEDDDED